MTPTFPVGILIATALLSVAGVVSAFPASLTLERAFPTNRGVELSQLIALDKIRHGRLLQSSIGVIDFPLEGTYDPYKVGLYFTKVLLGSPPREFHVQVDTGSDVLWVSCTSCYGCPRRSGLDIELNFFDPQSSSTSSLMSCSDPRCISGIQAEDAICSDDNSRQCTYKFKYGDGSGTSGYYVSDYMHFTTIFQGAVATHSSAPVIFGCSDMQTGDLTKNDRSVDGIFGFGQRDLSVFSQLASLGMAPRVFSHCLRGDSSGGGTLVLGEAVEPNIVYSPLVPIQSHYYIDLQSISVNGQILPISSEVFAASSDRGTIVDAGTTLTYLVAEAYDPFISAFTPLIGETTSVIPARGDQCYLISSSISDIFPKVSLNFAGGASMVLRPQDYLIQKSSSIVGQSVWCVGFMKSEGITILGDLVLKDKIVIYDVAGGRIGWTDYDCSQPINVSAPSKTSESEFVNTGQPSGTSSLVDGPNKLITAGLLAFFMHVTSISLFGTL